MIDTDKYEGHTPASEWRMVFSEAPCNRDKQMLGLKVEAYRLGQMQACDPEDYRIAQANQDLAREAPLLLEEIKRLRKALYWVAVEETREDVEYMWKGVDEILSDHPDWAQTKCIQTGKEWDYTKRDWTIDRAKELIE